ncbi:tetratricopeptide repeat protein [Namhaeicola litoreus]|uniref:Tetratricopeptide repeat-containing protein n=1 Tax=Namhaeicola litoreus TaxID=1052145 RepID=A0ABW3Y3U9_9FLAO
MISSVFDSFILLKQKYFKVSLLWIFYFIVPHLNAQEGLSANDAFDRALELRFHYPDSAVVLFNYSYDLYLKQKDTLKATNCLLEKSLVSENNAKYADSYDALWSVLILNDNRNDDNLKSVIYHRLGRIYSYYKREDESIKYLKKSLDIQKGMISVTGRDSSYLTPYYYALANTYRELDQYDKAKVYLDSCEMYFSTSNDLLPQAHVQFEKANLLAHDNKIDEAIKIMDSIFPYFQKNEPTYLVLFYKYLGDMYFNRDLNKSLELYNEALRISSENKSHLDFTPLIYKSLTDLYLQRNDYKNAFFNLNKAKELDDKFFGSRSSINQSVLEIKDDYRFEKERQEKQIQEQYLKQLEQEDKINDLKLIILLGSIVSLLIIGFGYIYNIRSKHKAEKEFIRKSKELEIKKTRELVDLKNKELAASALQLIEKDEFLKEIKSKIRVGTDKIKIHEINKLLRSISTNNNKNWDEFKYRFIEVNKDFYTKIFEKYPNLSQSDQKLCALIKLNFSSKEMARLLGISVESVHTSRHRIRKKMDLPRSTNLEDFINSL